jgi:hypothetical protein
MYTPGPWKAVCPRIVWRIMAGENFVMEGRDVRTEADARLIAEAPAMYEVIRSLLWNFPDLPEILGGQNREAAVKLIATAQDIANRLHGEQAREGGAG